MDKSDTLSQPDNDRDLRRLSLRSTNIADRLMTKDDLRDLRAEMLARFDQIIGLLQPIQDDQVALRAPGAQHDNQDAG